MISRLHIQAAFKSNSTYLKECYCTQPFKLADITEDKSGKELRLMLMSSSPGILDGDHYQIKIDLEEECSVHLQTQSYQRLFQMKDGASQQMEVHLAEGASLYYLPHPSVPHESSKFTAKNKVFLSPRCTLIWGEVLTCGRKLSGEQFLFSKYHNHTEIYLCGKLVVKENLLMQPRLVDLTAMGQLEGYTHQATLICLNEVASVVDLIKEVNEVLAIEHGLCYGISALPVNGFFVRVMGYKGEQLHNCLRRIALRLSSLLLQKQDEVNTVKPLVYAG